MFILYITNYNACNACICMIFILRHETLFVYFMLCSDCNSIGSICSAFYITAHTLYAALPASISWQLRNTLCNLIRSIETVPVKPCLPPKAKSEITPSSNAQRRWFFSRLLHSHSFVFLNTILKKTTVWKKFSRSTRNFGASSAPNKA